ncbi:C-type lectin 11 [Aphomia sociella]
MERCLFLIFFTLLAISYASPPGTSKIYRNDYIYNKKSNAFYKLHIEAAQENQAAYICVEEGAHLMVVDSNIDIVQFHEMYKQFPDLGGYVWVGNDKAQHQSAEEEAIYVYTDEGEETTMAPLPWNRVCNILTRHGELESYRCTHSIPFICKVDANEAPYDDACDIYGNGYEYVSSVGSCYKIPRLTYSWNEAYSECRAQGAHLVVLNSEEEHDAVWQIMKKTRPLPNSYGPAYYIAGFRTEPSSDDSPRVFKTIFNQTIEEAGYSKWAYPEPNNINGNENCGSLYEGDGKLNDQECNKRYGFICEKEKHSINLDNEQDICAAFSDFFQNNFQKPASAYDSSFSETHNDCMHQINVTPDHEILIRIITSYFVDWYARDGVYNNKMFKTYIIIVIAAIPFCISKQYRTDYVYNKKSNAFYKLHIESSLRYVAGKICKMEGAQLMYPNTELDHIQVHAMMKQYPDIGKYVWVQEANESHESTEEQPILNLEASEPGAIARSWLEKCNVMTREGDLEMHYCIASLPFVCKVEASDAFYDASCKVYGKGYQYVEEVRSCYKVSQMAFTWNEAYAECRAEGAHLVILNSETESDVVVNITEKVPNPAIVTWFYIAGFRAHKTTDKKPRVFMTIFNQTLEEAGFNRWSRNEPNNAMDNEYCGSIFRNDGTLNDVDCTHHFAFICEKELSVPIN